MLIKLQEKEGLHLANKIRRTYIIFFKQKMKVKLATQLLSQSVADALQFCDNSLHMAEFQHVNASVKFITIMNNAFDILNSHKLSDWEYKKALCEENIAKVKLFTSEFIDYNFKLKFSDSGDLVVYSSRKTGFVGFAAALKAVINKYKTFVESSKLLNFVPVYKLNQDHLELFFGSIRSLGGHNDNPSCLLFRTAYKELLIRAEIREGGIGNCVPLQQINILNCDLVKKGPVELINDSNVIYNMQDDDKEEQVIEHDYTIYCTYKSLSDFNEHIVIYIAGFVAKKNRKSN